MIIISETDRIPNTNYVCKDCDQPVEIYLCNGDFLSKRPEASNSDRWFCCTNVNCIHHRGEEHFQDLPKWVIDL